ncbi:MAG: hypothetical protein K6E46_05620 [Lachnospiraceae bacterium]|nr:hypothetical protein [Lachnospiraceae bacterium]
MEQIIKICVIIALIIIIVGIIFYLANKAYFKFLRHDKPTSYFKDLKWRNTDSILVGQGKVFKYLYPKKYQQKVYMCMTYKRSLEMDFAALKTYFSHVKPNGTVKIFADYGDYRKNMKLRTPADYEIVHPHIFLALNEKKPKRRVKYPIVFYFTYTWGYLFMRAFKMAGIYKKTEVKPSKVAYNSDDVKKMGELLRQMSEFCLERELRPFILLMDNKDKSINQELAEIARAAGDVEIKVIYNNNDFKTACL